MPEVDNTESAAETARWRVSKIGYVLAKAGLPRYEMDSRATSPLSDPVRQPGYLVCSYETDPDCVYVDWIDRWLGKAPAWRIEQVLRALRDAGYTVEEPGACGPVGPYRTHRYMRVTRPEA